MTLTSPAPSCADERFAVISEPRPGTIVELAPGSHLTVEFRRGLGPSRWHLVGIPGHVLVLADGGHVFQFLVFGADDCSVPLRFERRHPERDMAHEVCELLVVPVTDGGGRTARSASPRTA